MARRPDDPRYEETRTEPGRRYEEPQRSGEPGVTRRGHDGGRMDQAGRRSATTERGMREERIERVTDGNGSGIAAFVTGMLAITLAFLIFPAIAAVLIGIAAIVLGVMGMKKAGQLDGLHKGLSITGLVTGILALLLGAAVIIGGAAAINDLQNRIQMQELEQQLNEITE